jgi:pimeloyl-ACP methyl ester carboxylesterase
MRKFKIISLAVLFFFMMAALVLWILYTIRNIETLKMDAASRKDAPGKFISLDGGVTHYDMGGADTGKTVVLVHGFSVPYYIWDNIFDSLVQHGFHVVRYDEFGRGYSDRPPVDYLPALYTGQLYDLIGSLRLKTPVTLIGVSFGGAVITDFTIHHPELVDKLVLVDPVYHFEKSGFSELVADFVLAGQHEERAKGQLDDFKYPQHFPGWVDKYKFQMRYKGFRHALISTNFNFTGKTIHGNYKALDSLKKNILLIWGRDDKTVPFVFSDSLRKILHVQFFPVDDAAHLPYLEQPAIVSARMISFLNE